MTPRDPQEAGRYKRQPINQEQTQEAMLKARHLARRWREMERSMAL